MLSLSGCLELLVVVAVVVVVVALRVLHGFGLGGLLGVGVALRFFCVDLVLILSRSVLCLGCERAAPLQKAVQGLLSGGGLSS